MKFTQLIKYFLFQESGASNTESKKLKLLNKIKLTPKMIPLIVEMDEYRIVVCEQNDSTFLFTCGLNTCIGIAAFCRTIDGRTILGVTHLSGSIDSINFRTNADRRDVLYQTKNAEPAVVDKLSADFHPLMFNRMIDTIKKLSGNSEMILDIYMGGGTGDYPVKYQLYLSYINRRKDLKLCDFHFDAYKKTSVNIDECFSTEITKHLSVTLGITSTGNAILTKKLNLDDINEFKSENEIVSYCKGNDIEFPPNKELVFGFEALTWDYLYREDHEYTCSNNVLIKKNIPLLQPSATLTDIPLRRIAAVSATFAGAAALGSGMSAIIRDGNAAESAAITGIGTGLAVASSLFGITAKLRLFDGLPQSVMDTKMQILGPAFMELIGTLIGYLGARLFINTAVSTAPFENAVLGMPCTVGLVFCMKLLFEYYDQQKNACNDHLKPLAPRSKI